MTSNPIVNALIQAKNRGVEVIAIFDKVMLKNKILNDLKNSKIPILIDSKIAIAHNKVIVIDSRKIITGSFNFTNAAQFKNSEHLLILDSTEIANIFRNNWIQRSFVSKHL